MTIHLSEILVVLIVALVVIKPEQLPTLAMKLGRFVGWTRAIVMKIKRDLGTYE